MTAAYFYRGVLAVAGVLAAVASVEQTCVAQLPDISKWKAAEFSGQIQLISGTVIRSTNFANEPMFISLTRYVQQFSVKGMAEHDAIKPRMHVRFSGKVSAEGVLDGKVSEMYIFSPQFGFEPPEVAFDTEGSELVGEVVSNDRKGKLMVIIKIGKKPLKVTCEVAEDAKIHIDSSDPSLMKPGDKISVTGRLNKVENKDQANQIIAETVIVEMANPLSIKVRKPGPPEKVDPFKPEEKKEEKKEAAK